MNTMLYISKSPILNKIFRLSRSLLHGFACGVLCKIGFTIADSGQWISSGKHGNDGTASGISASTGPLLLLRLFFPRVFVDVRLQ
ncbi:hypothetical protein B0T09DRAFT_306896, partial [Sordaria sp. MPI-SDFR-AT-0083]